MLSRVVARKAFEVTARPCTLLSSFSENWGEVLEDVGQVYNLPFLSETTRRAERHLG
jgi:hypothetical protein